jgi:membrane protease YdiL (CAAX protease family)
VGAAVASIVASLLALLFDASLHLALLLSGVASDAWFLAAYHRRSRRLGWDTLLTRFRAIARPLMLASVAAGLALSVFPDVVTLILQGAGITIADIPADALLPSGVDQLPLTVLLLVILGPLGEELLFRGLLLDWLKQKVAAWQAIVISSLIFTLLHNNHLTMGVAGSIVFADRFLMGVGLSTLALRSQSLRGPFLMHAANNLVACIGYALDI